MTTQEEKISKADELRAMLIDMCEVSGVEPRKIMKECAVLSVFLRDERRLSPMEALVLCQNFVQIMLNAEKKNAGTTQ